MRRRDLVRAGALALAGCSTQPLPVSSEAPPAGQLPDAQMPPAAPREFRAAWIASVSNIDWPSRPGLPAEAQRAEALAMIERAQELGLNALVVQVRPAGDALYASSLEPWSEYLTGTQGRAPEPGWDPLSYWVEQAHRRGIELHAWFNPYRARHPSASSPLVAPHLALTHPQAVKSYGDLLWMDPAEPAAEERMLAVVTDVVRRYDIDGVHIDDYFYPYPLVHGGADQPFPDDPAWRRYGASGGTLARADWRREQVDRLVQALHRTVHATRPGVRFGISPFGLGRPDLRPPGITGFSQYDRLYADVEKWLAQGWLDYLAPQLYWPIERPAQAFGVLLDYWLAQNPQGRHVWPGLFTSRIGAAQDAWPAAEVLAQVAQVRTRAAAGGHLHFSMAALMQDRDGIATRLRAGPYAQPALVPATPWLASAYDAPPAPVLDATVHGLRIAPAPDAGGRAFVHAVWRREGGVWRFDTQPADDRLLKLGPGIDAVAVSAVDRLGIESPRTAWTLP